MAAFATVDELVAFWRPLTAAERVAAGSYLDLVAAHLRAQFKDRLGLDAVPADRLDAAKTISMEIVKTALATGQWPGHTAYGRTVGARSKSGTLEAPGGSLMLTDWQRQLLGLPVNPAPQWNFPEGDY